MKSKCHCHKGRSIVNHIKNLFLKHQALSVFSIKCVNCVTILKCYVITAVKSIATL